MFSNLGGKGVANAFSGTKLFVNNDIPEVNDFLQRYDGRGPVERIQAANTLSVQTNPSDFFKDCSYVPLNDYMLHEPDDNYATYATIDSIEPDEAWWYSACKPCNKKVKSDEKGLWCPDCGENPKSLTAKFKVYVRVVNDTGSTCFTLFDSHIKQLIGHSALDMRKRYLDDLASIPDELNEIVGKSFLFKFAIEPYNRTGDFHYYTVVALTEDSQTVAAFKNHFGVETELVSDTFVPPPHANYITAGRSSVKDSMSVLGDTVSTADSPHGKRPHPDAEVQTETNAAPESSKSSTNKIRR
uniref:replication protein A 70 kDa DNA-binding subunit B-like n=1 Tax=Erigeron canadensis TaxID=72917 RepID=UPI001CB98D86|nr:replication protein A 70 kDa DNA-binding subunit B-like [Erigeron canadensis]